MRYMLAALTFLAGQIAGYLRDEWQPIALGTLLGVWLVVREERRREAMLKVRRIIEQGIDEPLACTCGEAPMVYCPCCGR